MASTNILTSQSYTNKDFGSIYEELLDVAKQLSTVWDPTISNESDPGVVLLKLNAIIGDKNNYNIDSNVLEFYPETDPSDNWRQIRTCAVSVHQLFLYVFRLSADDLG